MIELENVAYSYGGGELLSDVSLKLAAGSFHFLTGPSGAGKTTLMKLCYGALLPTSGTLRLFDKDVRTLDRDEIAQIRRRVGVVQMFPTVPTVPLPALSMPVPVPAPTAAPRAPG